jgi:hypothetical protein
MKTKRIVTRPALRALACGMALAATADVSLAVVPEAQTLTDVPPAELMSVENGSVEAVETNGAPIWRWHVAARVATVLEPCKGASRIADVAPDRADVVRIAFTDGSTATLRLSDWVPHEPVPSRQPQ